MISQAHLATPQGSRYLQQLCKHWGHKFVVAFTPEQGSIDFGDGRLCSLSAAPDALTVRATAPPNSDMDRFQSVIADHLKRFAFREELSFVWESLEA